MFRIQIRRRIPIAALALGVALSIGPANALATPTWPYAWRPGWLPGDPVAVSSPMPGLWVTLDPVTRRPVAPAAEQRRARVAALQAAALPLGAHDIDAPLPVQRIPGGGELVHLNGRHMVFEVARRDASGHFTMSCASDSSAASRPISNPPVARAHGEER